MSRPSFGVSEAAKELGCTSQYVRILLSEDRIPGARKRGGRWRTPSETVAQLKQARKAYYGVDDETWQTLIARCHERGVTFLRELEESSQKAPNGLQR